MSVHPTRNALVEVVTSEWAKSIRDHARELETELAEAKARIAELEAAAARVNVASPQPSTLRRMAIQGAFDSYAGKFPKGQTCIFCHGERITPKDFKACRNGFA
jgi:hypothetical protein